MAGEQLSASRDGADDNRMLWLRELTKPLVPDNSLERTEIEFASDSYMIGTVDYADHRILCQISTPEPDARGLFRYTLILRRPPFDAADYFTGPATTDGYFFEGGPGAEILALISLCCQARVFAISIASSDSSPDAIPMRWYFDTTPTSNNGHFTPSTEACPVSLPTSLIPFLDTISHIPQHLHPGLALSAHQYSEALRSIGTSEELAFIRLVSAVETLSGDFELPVEDDPFKGSSFDNYVRSEKLSPQLKGELKNLFNVRKSRLKLVRFMQRHAPVAVQAEDRTRITSGNYEGTLTAIYKARSRYLHRGQPMYTSRPDARHADLDFSPERSKRVDRRFFDADEKLPFARSFQALVRIAIMHYAQSSVPPDELAET